MKYLAIFCSLMVIHGSLASDVENTPIDFRMLRLSGFLQKYSGLKKGEVMPTQLLHYRTESYLLSWVKGSEPENLMLTTDCSSVVEVAIASAKGTLPEDLVPSKDDLLSIVAYKIESKEGGSWVWIVEFKMRVSEPMAGSGYPQTLFIPVECSLKPLLEVKRKNQSDK